MASFTTLGITNSRCSHSGRRQIHNRQNGILHVSKDDHPRTKNPHRSVDKIGMDFSSRVKGGGDVESFASNAA